MTANANPMIVSPGNAEFVYIDEDTGDQYAQPATDVVAVGPLVLDDPDITLIFDHIRVHSVSSRQP